MQILDQIDLTSPDISFAIAPEITELGLETKELFVLAEVDAHPHPAELAGVLSMPKPP
jgi:hypothetical protein